MTVEIGSIFTFAEVYDDSYDAETLAGTTAKFAFWRAENYHGVQFSPMRRDSQAERRLAVKHPGKHPRAYSANVIHVGPT